jgi:hypothetical protein
MHKASEWLRENNGKGLAAEKLGYSQDQFINLCLADVNLLSEYSQALYNVSIDLKAPHHVQEELLKFKKIINDGLAKFNARGSYLQKTLSSLIGIDNINDIPLILKGALPHAPTDVENSLVMKMSKMACDFIKTPNDFIEADLKTVGIESGGSIPACIMGCIVCEGFCLVCCTIMY